MKTRNCFVSNSSSSSFIILKQYLSPDQIEKIKNYFSLCKNNPDFIDPDHLNLFNTWKIDESDEFLFGSTCIDNFDMYTYMKTIGVNPDLATWRD